MLSSVADMPEPEFPQRDELYTLPRA